MLWCLLVVADRVDRVRERVRERAAVRLRDFPQHFVAVRPSAEHRRAEFTLVERFVIEPFPDFSAK